MSRLIALKKAKEARKKPSTFGPDIDLGAYSDASRTQSEVRTLTELPAEIRERSGNVGIDDEAKCRSGSFFQVDQTVILSSAYREGLEVMSTTNALNKYKWLGDYWWNAVKVDADKYTAQAELKQNHGYFLRTLPGAKVEFPLQACLFITQERLAQNVHNIIIAEEGSELHIITGCAQSADVREGLHIGISEFYIKKNAKITFTMIHSWGQNMAVRPRSAAIVHENGMFLSNFICMEPVKTLQMYPTAYCVGKNSIVRFSTILFAHDGSNMDVGSRVFLKAGGSRAEVIARTITRGGDIIARGHLIGEVPDIKAHLECRGLILSDKGTIHAIPELEGRVRNIDMSHEAAVGKISEDEIRYLMARGLSSDEATAAIVRGFLDVEIKGLPEHLEAEVKKALQMDEIRKRLL